MRPSLTTIALSAGFAALAVAFAQLYSERSRLDRLTEAPSALFGVAITDSSPKRPQIVFVFRPADCPESLQLIDRWNEESRAGKVRVTGIIIADGSDTSFVADVVKSYRIQFPVRLMFVKDIAGHLQRFGINELPVSLFFDEQDRLRAITPSALPLTDSIVRRAIVMSYP